MIPQSIINQINSLNSLDRDDWEKANEILNKNPEAAQMLRDKGFDAKGMGCLVWGSVHRENGSNNGWGN